MTQLFTEIGPRDDVHECDCCGRQEINVTVEVRCEADGQHFIFGPQCAESACHPWASLASKYRNFQPHVAAISNEGEYDDAE